MLGGLVLSRRVGWLSHVFNIRHKFTTVYSLLLLVEMHRGQCLVLITRICLWPSTNWDQTSPGWCTARPSSAPGLVPSWVSSYTLLWRSCLQRVPAAREPVEVHFDQDSPKVATAGWWRRHYGGGIWHQGCEGVCTSVGVGGRGFLDARRGEFQLNPVNDTI